MAIDADSTQFEAYATAQLCIVEKCVSDCSGIGSAAEEVDLAGLSEISSQVNLIVSGLNGSSLRQSTVLAIQPQLKRLGVLMDDSVKDLNSRSWLFRYRHAKQIAKLVAAADRVDSLLETFSLSTDRQFYDFVREATKETVA